MTNINHRETNKGRQVRPTHPGAILREDVLPELRLTQAQFADRLGLSRRTVNEVLVEKRPLSADFAHRLGRLLGNGPALWLNMQAERDLWDALHMDTAPYEAIAPIERERQTA